MSENKKTPIKTPDIKAELLYDFVKWLSQNRLRIIYTHLPISETEYASTVGMYIRYFLFPLGDVSNRTDPFEGNIFDSLGRKIWNLSSKNPKTLHNSDVSGATKNVSDLVVVGNGDMFQLLCKASSENEGWMKSTKAMEIDGVGCLVQVTTQQRNPDGSNEVADALTFAPGVKIEPDKNNGRKLVNMWPPPQKEAPKKIEV